MKDDYLKARKRGEKAFHEAVVAGKYPYLPDLDSLVKDRTITSRRIGTVRIPVSQVSGTKTAGRQNAFACNYMPLLDPDTEFAQKWISLFRHQTEEGISEPVQLYEYRHRFYVLEGNKRVSVFRYLDNPVIPAEVTRITDEEDEPLYEEFLSFYKVCPLYEMDFAETGRYRKLAKLFEEDLEHPWPEEKVRKLRSGYYTFAGEYEKRKSGEMTLSVSDAFYLYLSIYGTEKLYSRSDLAKNITEMKKEFLAESGTSVRLVSEPEKETGGSRNLLKILPGVDSRRLRIAFIYPSNAKDSPPVFEHETGRIVLSNRLRSKVITSKYENCDTPEKLKEALEAAASSADCVITVSPLQLEETLRTAVRYPSVRFLNCSLNQKTNAVRSYDVRMYEAKFLLGALSALFSEDHAIVYTAEVPVYGTIADINAFAIGAAMIDPDVKIYLDWSKTKQEETEELPYPDIRIRSGPVFPDNEDSTAYGIFRLEEDGSLSNLAAPVINWAVYYEHLAEMILNGSWSNEKSAVNYWWGMKTGVIDVHVSGSLPYPSRKLVSLLKNAVIEGSLDPFSGELHSQEKLIQGESGRRLSDEEIITMDWLNDNVIGTIPSYTSLNSSAKEMTDVSGVMKVRRSE